LASPPSLNTSFDSSLTFSGTPKAVVWLRFCLFLSGFGEAIGCLTATIIGRPILDILRCVITPDALEPKFELLTFLTAVFCGGPIGIEL